MLFGRPSQFALEFIRYRRFVWENGYPDVWGRCRICVQGRAFGSKDRNAGEAAGWAHNLSLTVRQDFTRLTPKLRGRPPVEVMETVFESYYGYRDHPHKFTSEDACQHVWAPDGSVAFDPTCIVVIDDCDVSHIHACDAPPKPGDPGGFAGVEIRSITIPKQLRELLTYRMIEQLNRLARRDSSGGLAKKRSAR